MAMMVATTAEASSKLHVVGRETEPISDGDVDLLVDDNEFLMPTDAARRTLWGRRRRRYISYRSLRANRVPCGRRGRSYYDCNRRGRANPYNRGCTRITRCARRLNY
ncbi:hypothetical protein RIF29_41356 [Crotalaria pallida]|uniref:Uncharacterized protein n=1 Tax=Crotalaria pallida TaxID=3830 RepID=A0AAN9EB33_CROPI